MQSSTPIDMVLYTTGSIILYIIGKIGLSDIALVSSIFAGISTGLLACYRFFKERKADKKKAQVNP